MWYSARTGVTATCLRSRIPIQSKESFHYMKKSLGWALALSLLGTFAAMAISEPEKYTFWHANKGGKGGVYVTVDCAGVRDHYRHGDEVGEHASLEHRPSWFHLWPLLDEAATLFM